MEAPPNIVAILNKLNESEDRWKAMFMGTWGFSYYLKNTYKDTDMWKKPFPFGLPASKHKEYTYTPEKLHFLLTSQDHAFTLGHLQTLFSLFEELLNESSSILLNRQVNVSK